MFYFFSSRLGFCILFSLYLGGGHITFFQVSFMSFIMCEVEKIITTNLHYGCELDSKAQSTSSENSSLGFVLTPL